MSDDSLSLNQQRTWAKRNRAFLCDHSCPSDDESCEPPQKIMRIDDEQIQLSQSSSGDIGSQHDDTRSENESSNTEDRAFLETTTDDLRLNGSDEYVPLEDAPSMEIEEPEQRQKINFKTEEKFEDIFVPSPNVGKRGRAQKRKRESDESYEDIFSPSPNKKYIMPRKEETNQERKERLKREWEAILPTLRRTSFECDCGGEECSFHNIKDPERSPSPSSSSIVL